MEIRKFDSKKHLPGAGSDTQNEVYSAIRFAIRYCDKMQKYLYAMFAALCLVVFSAGCQGTDKYNEILDNHSAVKLYQDGIWKPRYTSDTAEYTDRIKSKTTFVSINVLGELTEENMLEIMDYYEFTRNAYFGSGTKYLGERDTDFTCYAVFFQGETEEEIRRIKYYNREEVAQTEEDEPMFPSPVMRSRQRSQLP